MNSDLDKIFRGCLRSCTFIVTLIALLGFVHVVKEAWPALVSKDLWATWLSSQWLPREGQFGILAMVASSLAAAALGVAIAIPMSWCIAIAMIFYLTPKMKRVSALCLEIIASVPTVLLGLFGSVWFVPLWAGDNPGYGLGPAACVLSIMLIPQLSLASLEIIVLDLDGFRQTAATLAIRTHVFIRRVLWPAKRHSLFQVARMSAARALGETLALMMVTGNVIAWPQGFDTPIRTLNATIALEMPYAQDAHRGSLFFLGLVTLTLVWLCHGLSRKGR